jgi:HSP20 family protein
MGLLFSLCQSGSASRRVAQDDGEQAFGNRLPTQATRVAGAGTGFELLEVVRRRSGADEQATTLDSKETHMLTARFPRMIPATAFARTMDQLVDSVFSDSALAAPARRFPAVNAWEDAQGVYVEAELPGFKIEDLDITFSASELTIQGKRGETKPEGATVHRRERPTGAFSRTLRVATDVDAGKVSATLVNGVLTVTLPKAEAARPRKIDVKIN